MPTPGRESGSRHLLDIIDSIPSLIHTGTPDGYLDYFNRQWLEYFGLPLEDLLGWKWTVVVHPDDVEGIVNRWRLSLASGEPFLYEARVRRADGKYRWMLHRKVAVRDQAGSIVKWHGSSIDIEERKQTEFYLHEGQRLAHMGSWAFNPAGFDYWSSELFQIYGLDAKRKPPTVEEYLGFVYPEDREFVLQKIQKMLSDHRGFDFTKRIVRPDGKVRHVRWVGVPVAGCENFQGFVGTGIDVTEQEELTEELRKSEMELRQMLDLTPQHVHVLAADATVVYSNEVARKYHGLTLDEWKERPLTEWRADEVPFTLFHPDDRERLMGELKNKFLSGSPHETEARLLRGDGKYRWFLFRLNPLRDRQGCVMRWYVAGTDIEDRKRVEEKLQQENVTLREEVDQTSMFEEIVGTSSAIQAALSCISKVAPSDSTVLITGKPEQAKSLSHAPFTGDQIARRVHS